MVGSLPGQFSFFRSSAPAVAHYINGLYNPVRRDSAFILVSPTPFEPRVDDHTTKPTKPTFVFSETPVDVSRDQQSLSSRRP